MNSRVEVNPNVGFTFIVFVVKFSSPHFKRTADVRVLIYFCSLSRTELTTNFWAEWHYRKVHWPHISDHGTADAGISRTTVQFSTFQLTSLSTFFVFHSHSIRFFRSL
jgi:hypothetical protein